MDKYPYEEEIKELRKRRDGWRLAYQREVQVGDALVSINEALYQLVSSAGYDVSKIMSHFEKVKQLRKENADSTQDALLNDEWVDALADFSRNAQK